VKKIIALFSILLLGLSLNVSAVAEPSPAELQKNFVAKMVKEHSFSANELNKLLDAANVKKKILEAISRPAEKRLNWGQYRKIFLTKSRTAGGLKFWKDNAKALDDANKKFGVPPQIIIAIIGVETRYGKHTGGYKVLDALVTLGFHYPKRGKFFRSELDHFLRLTREEGIDPNMPTGSYAGAMGRPQFISSSYREYAIDFDADGKKDIWENNVDVIGSVANYISRHGWKAGTEVAQRVTGANTRHKDIIKAGYKPHVTVAELQSKGIKLREPLDGTAKAALLELKTDKGNQHWVALNNFYTITRYNHSPLYAMAVFQLSEAIRSIHESSSKK